ncbi:MAG TPA: hypothetical protein VF326_01205 [Anaerolineaceae bacterium]
MTIKNKGFRLITCMSIVMLLLTFTVNNVSAADYYFAVDRLVANVYFNNQGIMSVDYVYDFANQTSGAPIDFVDIGLPTTSYDLSSVKADINGKAINDIQISTYVSGITLGLGGDAIQPGQKGTVHVLIGTIRSTLYPNKSNGKDDASFNFVPNYFGQQYVTGSTDETVSIHLPPGIKSTEPTYFSPKQWPGDATPQTSYDDQNRVTYTWQAANANGYTSYYFGASFPASYVPASAIVIKPTPEPNTGSSSNSSGGNNSWVIYVVIFFLVVVFSSFGGKSASQATRLAYLPPKISVEGHGIKRGLTAVEAAILMQLPLDKVLTMILFGVIKKGAATVVTKEPLKLEIASPVPEGLYPYEVEFTNAFKSGTISNQRLALQTMMVNLVKNISEKMKGFSQKETLDYYQDIMRRAWNEVETAGTPEVKSQKFDEGLEWTMLDRQFNDRTRTVFGPNPVFIPMWWGRFDPVYRGQASVGSVGPLMPTISQPFGTGASSSTGSMPSLPGSDFAASVINGSSTFAAGAIGDLTTFTGGITSKTNPAPPSSSGGSHGGGGHCACACACAGCACACAGGGR